MDALLYLKNPERMLQTIAELADAEAAEQIAPLDVKALLEAGLGPELMPVVDLTQPMQFAFLHDEGADEPRTAYSLGLLTSNEPLDLEFGQQCIRHTGASERARLVCSEAGPVTDGMLALFDRAATRVFAGDLLVELPQETLERAGTEAEAEPAPQDPTRAFGRRLANEFVDSLGSLAFELTLGDPYAELALEVEVRQTSGFLATLLVGDAAAALPPEFRGLPLDANLGVTLSGVEPNQLQKAAEPVWQAFEADLARYQPQTQVAAAVAEMRQLVLTGGPLLIASGPPGPAQARLAQSKDVQAQRLALQGWWSVGVHEPLERWVRGLEKLVELDQKQFPLVVGEPAKELRAPQPTVMILRKYPVPANSGLPKGSLHVRVWNTRNPDYVLSDDEAPPLETTTYVYVTGNPPTTWIVGSEHDRLALTKARELISAREASARAQIFRPPGAASARLLGFTTLKALVMHLVPTSYQVAMTATLGFFGGWAEGTEFPLRYSVAARGASQYARFSVGVPSEIIQSLVRMGLPLALIRWQDPAPPATPP